MDVRELVSQVQEFFGDFTVLDPHHFSVPVPRTHVVLQPFSWEFGQRRARKRHICSCAWVRICWNPRLTPLPAVLQHRCGGPDDRGPGLAHPLPAQALLGQVRARQLRRAWYWLFRA